MSSESKKEFRDYTPDELEDLCKKNPNLFVELADDAIEEACIDKTPERTRKLRQMQWLIDTQLRKAKTPLGRMLIMENIFYNRVYGYDGLLTQLISGCREFVRVFEKPDQVFGQKFETHLGAGGAMEQKSQLRIIHSQKNGDVPISLT